jgi:uncharacterized protein
MPLSAEALTVQGPKGPVSALLQLPENAWALLVLAHGAGAGMRHHFMEDVATGLSEHGIATLRYQFPYMEAGANRPDPPAVLVATVVAAVEAARSGTPLPLFAGGKSLGGRMSSHAGATGDLENVRGLVFFGFPLHPPKQPAVKRADHLPEVTIPMLFLQGTRDDLASLDLIRQVTAPLPLATLHVVEGANHSFEVLKRSGRTNAQVLTELAEATAAWMRKVLG